MEAPIEPEEVEERLAVDAAKRAAAAPIAGSRVSDLLAENLRNAR